MCVFLKKSAHFFVKEKDMNTRYADSDFVQIAKMMVERKLTVRQAAEIGGCSKSSFHLWIQRDLLGVDSYLYHEVKDLLDNNLKERHLRGGMATKAMYERKKMGA